MKYYPFSICKNIYKHKILLTHSIKSVWPSSPPTHHDLFENDSRKSPNSRIGYFCFKAMMRQKEFSPQIKVNNGVPTTFISCTYLDDAAGIKLGNIKERSCKSPTNLASKIHYKRQNGSAGTYGLSLISSILNFQIVWW